MSQKNSKDLEFIAIAESAIKDMILGDERSLARALIDITTLADWLGDQPMMTRQIVQNVRRNGVKLYQMMIDAMNHVKYAVNSTKYNLWPILRRAMKIYNRGLNTRYTKDYEVIKATRAVNEIFQDIFAETFGEHQKGIVDHEEQLRDIAHEVTRDWKTVTTSQAFVENLNSDRVKQEKEISAEEQAQIDKRKREWDMSQSQKKAQV